MKVVAYSKSAVKTLRKIPANDAKRIVAKIEQYASAPESLANNITELVGSRLRIGNWRVIMDDQGTVLDVLKIGPRGSVYE